MNKNFMPEVAALLGVELGEKFIIQNADRKETVVLAMDGFHVIQPNDVLGPDHGKLLSKVLQGLYEVKKIPWEPKYKEEYFYPNIRQKTVTIEQWTDETFDYAIKALNMVYRTREEAEANFASDYEKLTGKSLSFVE